MPTIESRKYGHTQFVSASTWKQMKEKGIARRFRVIDDSDIGETITATPEELIDFQQKTEDVKNPVNKTVEKLPEMSREDLKKWLTEHRIEFNTRATTDKLYGLYLNNQ